MLSYLKSKEQEILLMLERLVNKDSGSHYKKGVDAVGKLISNEYKQLNFTIDTVHQTEVGNHLFLRHKEAKNPKIIILGHLDTVFKEGTVKERPFMIRGSRAYGPGVIDMKGSHVTLLYALKALIKNGEEEAVKNVHLFFNSDEEIGSTTSHVLIENVSLGKQYALVMEPARPDGSLVSSRRGGGHYILKVYGKASHAGIAPEEGISAIEELSYKVVRLQKLNKDSEGINVNVGMIRGGESANVICPYAEAIIDIRIDKAEQGIWIDQEIRKICSVPDVPGAILELEGGIHRSPMVKNEGTNRLLEIVQEVGEEMGVELKDVSTGGNSDASFTSNVGVPTLDGLGPVGGNAHSDEEYLEIPSLVERSLLLANIIKKLSY
ncbi:carboxypeptidase [Ureibacillus massiliensis 4400831 = CIP 108448 = CCUG 49529]|uniref:Carboxypeptidase n=1 Tax=Ureibacillus massiliensis 4400831 = CIP 108448 = CCUG 49529 TaxID=1211035 RepID=A0A0A3J105_9BACL|nr:M20 family metallopeptidase [Ureibacillus massiliensis]KGR90641.1 carboxypeptidase [Ureibacillus massiliensis 4400831 = CIP 108448 = CCUG 49529]